MTWKKQNTDSSTDPNSHSHANKVALDRLGVNTNNKLTIDNVEQSGGTVTSTNKLNGLKWAVLGDSITEASYGSGSVISYHKTVSNQTGIVNLNYGVSATTVAIRSGRTDSMLERYVNMDATADVITVLGGTNDFGAAAPVALGTIGNGDTSTFYGAYEALVVGLMGKYPNKPIGFMTPIRRGRTNSLINYVNAIKEVCAIYSVPVLDLYSESGLSTQISYHASNYFYMNDNLHPNTEGAKIIAKPIKSFLERIVG